MLYLPLYTSVTQWVSGKNRIPLFGCYEESQKLVVPLWEPHGIKWVEFKLFELRRLMEFFTRRDDNRLSHLGANRIKMFLGVREEQQSGI